MKFIIEHLSKRFEQKEVLRDIDFTFEEGRIYGLLGRNGAGKTTLLRCISGILKPSKGEIRFEGKSIAGLPAYKVAKYGIAQVLESRHVFPKLTVMENIEMGAFLKKDNQRMQSDIEKWFEVFPRLKERIWQTAGTLSGGEQEMLAMVRGLISNPKLLILDEPSMGLAPIFIDEIFNIIPRLQKMGTTILLVEQNASMALAIADRGYVMETGNITLTDTGRRLLNNDKVRKMYLGEE